MEQALIDLVKSGVPLAKYAITWYYVYWTLDAVLLCAVFGIPFILCALSLIRWVRHVIEFETKTGKRRSGW